MYFHEIPAGVEGQPTEADRVFGYIQKVNVEDNGEMHATVVVNKDLNNERNQAFGYVVRSAVRHRLGIANAVTLADVTNCFRPPLDYANAVLGDLWRRVVANAYGNKLPFGRLWDAVFGLARFIASFNSPRGGRKSELIMTHYFASRFGERIQSAGANPQVDFFLLPTMAEVTDPGNLLHSFPKFASLIRVAEHVRNEFADDEVDVDGVRVSKFTNPRGGMFDTNVWREFILPSVPYHDRSAATECFNAFDKGPPRTIIALLMLADIRARRINYETLTPRQLGGMYDRLGGTHQAPKVINIYAQQALGNIGAFPKDLWIKTLLKWPLCVWPEDPGRNRYRDLLSMANNPGKVERLLWIAAQARKVHSSACDDSLWCIKRSSTSDHRGANPLACKQCVLKRSCPAFARIVNRQVTFNAPVVPDNGFNIVTSEGNNQTVNQRFVSCTGNSIYDRIFDDFSGADCPSSFAPFPTQGHQGEPMTVADFINRY